MGVNNSMAVNMSSTACLEVSALSGICLRKKECRQGIRVQVTPLCIGVCSMVAFPFPPPLYSCVKLLYLDVELNVEVQDEERGRAHFPSCLWHGTLKREWEITLVLCECIHIEQLYYP